MKRTTKWTLQAILNLLAKDTTGDGKPDSLAVCNVTGGNLFANGITLGDGKPLTLGSITLTGQTDYAPTVTFTNLTNKVNAAAHTFSNGDLIQFTTGDGGTVPAELALDTNYYIVSIAAGTFQVALTKGGSAIAFTDDGTATVAATLQPVLSISDHISFPDNKGILFGTDKDGYIKWDGSCLDIRGTTVFFADTTNQAYVEASVSALWMGFGSNGAVFQSGLYNINPAGIDMDTVIEGDADTVLFTTDAALDRVGVGVSRNAHAAKFHVDQSNSAGDIPAVAIDQADESEGFINFIGFDAGVIGEGVNSVESVRVEVNGTVRRLAVYADA